MIPPPIISVRLQNYLTKRRCHVMNGSKKYAADGFTYMEMLLSLMTAALIMAVMPAVIALFQTLELQEDYYDTDIFTLDIMETYKACRKIEAAGTAVHFTTDRGKIRSEEHTSELQSRFELVC